MKMKLADCRDYNIVRKSAIIDSVLWGNFKETARRHKVSPSALLCTLYGRIMAKWGNQSEVLLNLTVFQRQQKNTEKLSVILQNCFRLILFLLKRIFGNRRRGFKNK